MVDNCWCQAAAGAWQATPRSPTRPVHSPQAWPLPVCWEVAKQARAPVHVLRSNQAWVSAVKELCDAWRVLGADQYREH